MDRSDRAGRAVPCLLSLWPGLPQLWRQGSWLGLAQSLAFAFLLQLTVLTSLLWPESVSWVSRAVVWFCVIGFWLLFAAPGFGRALAAWRGGFSSVDSEHLFVAAQREYLRGNWHQAEQLLAELLGKDSGDVDARFLLASLYRHAGRQVAAKENLDRLVESHGSEKWSFEVFHERLQLARAKRRSVAKDSTEPMEPVAESSGAANNTHEAA